MINILKNTYKILKFITGVALFLGSFYALYLLMWAIAPENSLGLY